MAQVTIKINSREYSLACEDGQEERIITLSKILDEKSREITSSIGQINESLLLAMVGILVADEMSRKNPNQKTDLKEEDEELAKQISSITEKINSITKSID